MECDLAFVGRTVAVATSVAVIYCVVCAISSRIVREFRASGLCLASVFMLLNLLHCVRLAIISGGDNGPAGMLLRSEFLQ